MKIFKSNNNDTTFISQLLDVINPSIMRSIVEKYSADYRTQGFDSYSHFFTMMYLQLNDSKTLRCCITELQNDIDIDPKLYVPSLSQLSRKNSTRDYRVFEDIFYYLLKKLKKKIGIKEFNSQFKQIKAFDSTIIDIASKLAPEFHYDKDISAIKMSTLFNLTEATPEKVNIVKGKVNDRKCIDGFIQDRDCLYLFDRGYYNYSWYDKLTRDGINFITRQVSNACVEEVKSRYTGIDHIYDYDVILGSDYSKNKTEFKYREILIFDNNEKEVRFLTNIFNLSAQEILNLYKMRWQIELFFKWIKQNLRIKHWIGRNENAIKIQLYSALIAYVLIRLIQEEINNKYSILKITRIIRVYITKKVNLLSVFIT